MAHPEPQVPMARMLQMARMAETALLVPLALRLVTPSVLPTELLRVVVVSKPVQARTVSKPLLAQSITVRFKLLLELVALTERLTAFQARTAWMQESVEPVHLVRKAWTR